MDGEETYQVRFMFKNAFTALFAHFLHQVLGPFCLPIIYLVIGKTLAKNMNFKFSVIYFIGDFPIWCWSVTALLNAVMNYERIQEITSLLISIGSIFVIRNLLVSLKYGYFPEETWERLKTVPLDAEEITSFLILFSWINVPYKISEREIRDSFKRVGIDPSLYQLKFSQEAKYKITTELNQIQNTTQAFEDEHLEIDKVTLFFVRKVCTELKLSVAKYVTVFAVLYAFSPFALAIYRFGFTELYGNGFFIANAVVSIIPGLLHSRAFLLFITTALYDFKRKNKFMQECFKMISTKQEFSLDMNDELSLLSWYYLRRGILDFGKRYTLRVFMYISLILPVCLSIILILLLQVFGVVGIEYNFYFVPTFMLVSVVLVILLLVSLSATKLNEDYQTHRDCLMEHIFSFRTLNSKSSHNKAQILEFVVSKLKHDETMRPVKVLGVTIDNGFISRLVVSALSGLFAIVQIYYRS